MKGISTIIGALIVLIITITLGGLAYTYITSTTQSQITKVLEITETTCSGTAITVGVKNTGTAAIDLSTIKISGTTSDGGPITEIACAATGQVNAGVAKTCATVTGEKDTNTIKVTYGGKTLTGIVSC